MPRLKLAKPVFEIPTKITDYLVLIHGGPGIGKSSFAAQTPDHYIFDFEHGYKALPYRGEFISNGWTGDVPSGAPFEHMWDVLALCKDAKDITTIIIDPAEAWFEMVCAYVCSNSGTTHINTGPLKYGVGYKFACDEIRNILNETQNLGMNVLLVSHSREIEIEEGDLKYSKSVPDFPASARKVLMDLPDLVLYFGWERFDEKGEVLEEPERHIYAQPSEDFEAKSRIMSFEGCSMGNSPQEARANFEAAFEKAIKQEQKAWGSKRRK